MPSVGRRAGLSACTRTWDFPAGTRQHQSSTTITRPVPRISNSWSLAIRPPPVPRAPSPPHTPPHLDEVADACAESGVVGVSQRRLEQQVVHAQVQHLNKNNDIGKS
jgi:hypothetical protein